MSVLVTGSSGLIGQWVCNTLSERGFNVVGLDKVETQNCRIKVFHKCDILDRVSLRAVFSETQPDHVIHLAARIDLEEKKDINGYATNTDGVRNILELVQESATIKRVIITSSQLVCKVGYVPKNSLDYCPSTLYGQSKVLTEKITRDMDGGGKEWCLTRPTTVWGPGMNVHYQRMLHLIQKGHFFHCGNKKLYKSYSYAGNIAIQYLKLLIAPVEAINRKVFYLADYEPLSLRDYIDGLADAMNAPPVPTIPVPMSRGLAMAGDVLNLFGISRFPFNSFRLRNILTEYQFDMRSTQEVCGELPYSFEEGVKATAEWFLSKQREPQTSKI